MNEYEEELVLQEKWIISLSMSMQWSLVVKKN